MQRSVAIEEGSDRLETAALRYALTRKAKTSDAPEVSSALEDLERAALALLDLHKQETPEPCVPRNPTSASLLRR